MAKPMKSDPGRDSRQQGFAMRRWLGRAGFLLLALLAVGIAANWRWLTAFPGVLPGFTAKEHCSCRFVMGQDEAYCRLYSKQYIPIGEIVVDEAARRVTARGTGVTRSARWLSPREGCRMEP